MSVYGTASDFLGHANLGSSALCDLTLEYSLARKRAVATEFQFEQDNPTHVAGFDGTGQPAATGTGLGRDAYVMPYLAYG